MAIHYFKTVSQLSINNKFNKQLSKAHSQLYKIYKQKGDNANELIYSNLLADIAIPLLNLKENLEKLIQRYQLQRMKDQQDRKNEGIKLEKERTLYWLTLTTLVLALTGVGYHWRKYVTKWNKLKDKYNDFVTKYNDFLIKYRATIAKQLKLNRELGALANTPIRDPREYLWKNFDEEDEDGNGDN